MNALVVARDIEVVSVFSHLFGGKGINTQKCVLESEALEKLSSEKFTAVVLDFDDVAECSNILRSLPRPNRNAVVFAIATQENAKRSASDLGASFLIQRPLVEEQIRGLLRQSYGRMLRDGQAYSRLAIALPVWIRKESASVLECTTINLSQSGMAVRTPSVFQVGERVNIGFAIPNRDIFVRAEGTVIWDDKHGRAGITFECDDSSVRAQFFEWLQDHFFASLPDKTSESTSRLISSSSEIEANKQMVLSAPHALAHELRNHLGVIKGHCDLLSEEVLHDEGIAGHLNAISIAIATMTTLLKDL